MENPGEHFVGQYLKYIKKCDFVEYNLQTIFTQGEIDVVGINSITKQIYVCEVATHLETGLQYTKNNQPDNVKRFISKFEKNIEYVKINFKDYACVYMLWTPIIKVPKNESVKHNQLKDVEEIEIYFKEKFKINLQIIFNEAYLKCIKELRDIAVKTPQELKSPIMRFLQIEGKLKKSIKQ
jgi:hypothetical protein